MRKWIIPTVLGLMVMGAIGIWGNTQRLANRNTEIFGQQVPAGFF